MPCHFKHKFATLLSLSLALIPRVGASPCISFDSDFNLYAFGFGGKDLQLGTQDKWSSTVNPTDVTSTGRPPFDGPQTTCYLAQFFNVIYVLDGDKSHPSDVHIYDVKGKSWSTQSVSAGGPDPSSLAAILDHDTNVIYALGGDSTLSFLDLGQLKAANSAPLTWKQVGKPSFDTTNYKPVMALAQNHIHFLDVPGSQPGTAFIFVIHFSFFQPKAQTYPVSGGGSSFPASHGQAVSFFRNTGVQEEFAFIPDDGSAAYVVSVESNTTVPLPGPSTKSPSTYAASTSALVQLTSTGSLSFIPYTSGNAAANKGASWNKINVQGLPTISGGTSGGSTPTGNATGTSSGDNSTQGSTKSMGSGKNDALPVAMGSWFMALLSVVWMVTFASGVQ